MIYRHFEELDSTNSWAKRELQELLPGECVVVSTNYQTGGRGQRGNTWFSPPGENALMSLCFKDEGGDPLMLTRLAAKTILEMLNKRRIIGTIKWPNDILVKGKKIAGILCETDGPLVIIGIGWNINSTIDTLATIDAPATSLFEESGNMEEVSAIRYEFAELLLYKLDILY